MATQNTPSTQPQQLPQKSVATFLNMPTTSRFLEATLKEKRAEFVSNLIALCDSDANLSACDHSALMKCALNATALNLPLNKNLGYAYIIPYKSDGIQVPQFQIGYKGLIQLAIRTGAYRFINAVEVREGEIKQNKLTGEITFIAENPENKIVGYIAYLELTTGFSASLYMTEEKIEAHAIKYSKMYAADKKYGTAKSKWSDPDSRLKMSLKTVLKGLLGTYGLMTTEFAKALEIDGEDEDPIPHGGRVQEAEIITQSDPMQGDVQSKTFKI